MALNQLHRWLQPYNLYLQRNCLLGPPSNQGSIAIPVSLFDCIGDNLQASLFVFLDFCVSILSTLQANSGRLKVSMKPYFGFSAASSLSVGGHNHEAKLDGLGVGSD